ncbi:hypothetical protein SAMN06265795_103215 [Noviherbaspirillum humi]|uniref:Lipoprotein n=1 Tax=Noviherbaspirillum humi TaxID=1688639 RepID=A0A239F7C8_9BURK|nr:hypothetical protein [Noviherbaspirillum humi]SNS52661.1 hypothetical protein SAMN06265795_103215 [Noviherbaspirillum humi]
MIKQFFLPTLLAASLSACVAVPVEPVAVRGNACPPGQAKKGNCAPETDRGFCPPGQAKKGAC